MSAKRPLEGIATRKLKEELRYLSKTADEQLDEARMYQRRVAKGQRWELSPARACYADAKFTRALVACVEAELARRKGEKR